MRNISGKSYRQHQNTHIILNNVLAKVVPFIK